MWKSRNYPSPAQQTGCCSLLVYLNNPNCGLLPSARSRLPTIAVLTGENISWAAMLIIPDGRHHMGNGLQRREFGNSPILAYTHMAPDATRRTNGCFSLERLSRRRSWWDVVRWKGFRLVPGVPEVETVIRDHKPVWLPLM